MRTGGAAEVGAGKIGHQLDRVPRSWQGVVLAALLVSTTILGGCSGLVNGTKGTGSGHAVLQVTPLTINFGKVGVGKQGAQPIAFSNSGSVTLNVTQVGLSNPQFTLTGVTLPMAMAPGQTANFSVGVSPSATGTVTGTLTVQGDAGTAPVVVDLSATAVTPAPQISLSSNTVSFGNVSVNSQGNSNLTISNSGTSDLTISVISLTGAEFGISGISTPKTISAGQSVPVALTFHPTSAGAVSGSITITSNDPANPTETVTLSGTGSTTAIGQLQANPTSLSFGNVGTGSSASRQISITNTGTASVSISGVVASGSGFSVSGVSTPSTLAPSASATLNVDYAPTAAGSVTGTVTITSNAQGSPLAIPLSGTGVQAGLSISPASFNFGSVVDGQTKSQTFTLKNTGSASLTISQLGVNGAGYSINGLATPSTLAAGGTASFSAVFAPTTAGNLNGSVIISSNAPNSPATVSLAGTGVAASVTLGASPNSLVFGNVNAGSSSSKNVTLTNNGNSNVTISQVTVSAKDVTTSGVSTPLTLTPGQSHALSVNFNPTAAEAVSGSVTVTSSQGSSAVIGVSGTGVQAALSLTPTSATFGNVAVGSSNSQTIQLRNTGNGLLTITQASVAGNGFSASGLNLPLSISAGQTSTFNADFQPSAVGSASGSITIVSNAAGSPSTVLLNGTGVNATLSISLSSNNFSFGNVDTGTSSSKTETITNTGNSSVQISQISVSGTGYSLNGANVPVTLTPSQSLTFSVLFSPTAAGSATGSVTVSSNANGSPATISLSGSGVQATPQVVSLTWNASTSAVAGYNVYRSLTSGSGYVKVNGALVSGLTYTDTTVLNATTYYYVTTSVDTSGTESNNSNEAQAIVP